VNFSSRPCEVIRIYAAGTSGKCTELQVRLSDAADVDKLYARHSQRFPQLREIVIRNAGREAEPDTLVDFIGQTYRASDPSLDAIPQQADAGYDSWCPRDGNGGAKYWDRVPLSAMIDTGYFNCLYGAALTARALSEMGCEFSLLICPAVPTHPYVGLADRPDLLFSFHHDGLRRYQGQVEIKNLRYTPEMLIPISDYGPRDGIYGLSVPEHFLIPARLVPWADNAARAIEAFADLAARLAGYPRLERIATLIRLSIIPRLRSGPIPFARTIEDDIQTPRPNHLRKVIDGQP
jgi:hypothetical protein